jgi:thioesterase domain-containing protein
MVAPRTRMEKALAAIWTELLNLEQVSITDNFFEVGGHSLLAVQLLNRMNKQFGPWRKAHGLQPLALSTLFQVPTIKQAALLLQKEARPVAQGTHTGISPLVPLQSAGEKRPFFCVHPGPGDVYCLLDLAKHLHHDRPFYGIQAPGLHVDHDLFSSIEEMAASYIDELLAIQPEAPYFLGGYSFGGAVAFEMARQLQAQGRAVALLAILDTSPSEQVLSDRAGASIEMGESARTGQYRSNNETTQPGHAVPQGRRKAPDPCGWVPPLPCNNEGERATGTCGDTVGVGGIADVGWGPCADPGSPSSPYLSGIAHTEPDGTSLPSTHPEIANGYTKQMMNLIEPLSRYWRKKIVLSYDDLCHLQPDEQLAYFLDRLREAQVVPDDMDLPQVRRLMQVEKANDTCLQKYRPKPYAGPITLFRSEKAEYDPSLWTQLSSEPVETHTVAGDHISMVIEPYVRSLAAQLQQCLDKADGVYKTLVCRG